MIGDVKGPATKILHVIVHRPFSLFPLIKEKKGFAVLEPLVFLIVGQFCGDHGRCHSLAKMHEFNLS